MIRGVVHYPQKLGATGQGTPDDYLDKLAKYVPAEVTAAYVALTAGAAQFAVKWPTYLVFGVCLAATPAYLYIQARRQNSLTATRWYFYLLATPAFFFWATNVSDGFRDFVGWSAKEANFYLAIAAFVIPLIDAVVDIILAKSKGGQQQTVSGQQATVSGQQPPVPTD